MIIGKFESLHDIRSRSGDRTTSELPTNSLHFFKTQNSSLCISCYTIGAKCQIDHQCVSKAMKGKDQVTQIIGQVGPFQLFWWATLSFSTILHSLGMMSNKFQLYEIDYWCERRGSFQNTSIDVWLNVSAPLTPDGKFDRCRIYDMEYNLGDESYEILREKQAITACTKWEYDTSQFKVRYIFVTIHYK